MKEPTHHHVVSWLADQLVKETDISEAEGRLLSVIFARRAKEARETAKTCLPEDTRKPNVHLIEAEVYESLSKLFIHPESWRPE